MLSDKIRPLPKKAGINLTSPVSGILKAALRAFMLTRLGARASQKIAH